MDNVYEVEAIIGHRKNNSNNEYLVQWKGFPKEDATWEPAENLTDCKKAINDFLKLSLVSFYFY